MPGSVGVAPHHEAGMASGATDVDGCATRALSFGSGMGGSGVRLSAAFEEGHEGENSQEEDENQ